MIKQSVNINFSQGLNTKTDEWQIPVGQFLSLENSVFTKGGLLQKRNGYGEISSTSPLSSYITTLNDNLTSIGSTVNAFSSSLGTWISKGNLQPCSLNTLPLIRNDLNQTMADSAISNGLVCTVYSQVNAGTTQYLYVVADEVTGQNIVQPTLIPTLSTGTISGTSRVFVVGTYFVVISKVTISSTSYLQYFSIPISNPTNVSAAQNVYSEAYVPVTTNPGWDAVSYSNNIVVAYNATSGGQGVHIVSLSLSQIASNQATTAILKLTNAAYIGSLVSICVDPSSSLYYVSFYNNSNNTLYTTSAVVNLGTITQNFSPTSIDSSVTVANIASVAINGTCYVYYEITNAYSYDSGIPSNYIKANTINSAGTIGTPYVLIRSVGLASKAFIINNTIYLLSAYQSPYQNTYFLINASVSTSASPVIVAKLAYENGGGYLTLGLPNVTIDGSVAQIPYLYKDLVEALSTVANPQQTTTGGIYSQTGINLASFDLETTAISTSEIAGSLHISGGFLSMYDGYLPVEQNFFLWPDSVELTQTTGGSMSAQQYYYQATYEWSDNQGNIHRSAPSIPVTTTLSSNTAVIINVPTLRLTQKVSNPVKIVIYRWSVAQPVYYQVTSITSPKLNSTTIDSVSFTDTLADASIAGNNLIYTTGGVVEDINAPASDILTVFDTRLWLVDSEDRNLLWVSKRVVENTPVEMSDLFTIYIAPNIGTTGTSGPITAIAPMDSNLIIFKKNSIFYISGTGPNDLGSTSQGCTLGNYSQPYFITSVVGCMNQQSLVMTQNGLMFQSDKGIWRLNRNLSTEYIGAPVETYNNQVVNSANVVPGTNYVLFTLDNGIILMYDYYYNQWGTFNGIPTTSSCIYQGKHTVLSLGRILQEKEGSYLDASNPVLLSFTTGWINMAGLQGYERFYDFYILAKYLSPHYLNVQVSYDYNSSVAQSKLINPTNNISVSPGPFGSPNPFGGTTNLEQWRIHTKKQLCESFQLSINEVFNPSAMDGAGFSMSGINAQVGIKKSVKPFRAANATGVK